MRKVILPTILATAVGFAFLPSAARADGVIVIGTNGNAPVSGYLPGYAYVPPVYYNAAPSFYVGPSYYPYSYNVYPSYSYYPRFRDDWRGRASHDYLRDRDRHESRGHSSHERHRR
jgi:hypothetical protein